MNYDQFATSFQNPEESIRCGEISVEAQKEEVVLAGTILAATDKFCCIDINGAQYEIASSDVIDIEVVSPKPSSGAKAEAAQATGEAGEGQKADERAEADAASTTPSTRFALIRVNKNAVLLHRIPVPAVLLAAVGTWVKIVPPAAKAA
jgi:hypothetical protein